MEATMIADLNPGDGDVPIEIKVIRKWLSFGKRSECCYIFIDKNGDAIQAGANLSDKSYFDPLIKVDTCYRLSNYICEIGKTFMVTVPNNTGIRFGKAANFQTIPNDGFPAYYFNFLDYDHLNPRLDNHKILTDYIGKIENVTNVFKSKRATIMRIKLENLSGTMIESTFWDDAAVSFNKEAVASLPSPVIAAVTSMKVTQYHGRLQLTATPASYIYINPEIDVATTLANEFVIRNALAPVLEIEYERSTDIEVEKQRNRFTLAELLAQNPERYVGAHFTCKAALASVDVGNGWFYKACDQCRRKLQPRGDTLACEDHGTVIEPKQLYFIVANMADHTAAAKTTFFDASAALLLGTNCKEMIDHQGYTDPHILPVPIANLRGKTKIFQMRFSTSSTLGAIDFVVDRVFEDIIIPGIEHQRVTANIELPATSKTVVPASAAATAPAAVTLAPAPATPAPALATHAPVATPLTATPSLPISSSSVTTQTQGNQQSSVKKELFPAPAQTSTERFKKQKLSGGILGQNMKKGAPTKHATQ